jgi:hypothetical protein
VNLRRLAMTGFARLPFAECSLRVAVRSFSLFLPVIESAQYSGNACAAGLSGVFDCRLGVFFQNDPDIGLITGRPVLI